MTFLVILIITILDKLDIRKWDGSDAQKFKVTVENLLSDVLKGNTIHRQQLFFTDFIKGSHVYVEDLHNFEIMLQYLKLNLDADTFHYSRWSDQSPAGYIMPKVYCILISELYVFNIFICRMVQCWTL